MYLIDDEICQLLNRAPIQLRFSLELDYGFLKE